MFSPFEDDQSPLFRGMEIWLYNNNRNAISSKIAFEN